MQARATRRGQVRSLVVALLAIALILSPALQTRAAAATATYVQGAAGVVASGTTVSQAFGKANNAGSLVLAYVIWNSATTTAAVTDTRGNVYASVAAATRRTGASWSAQLFYAKNVAAGTNTVTARFSAAVSGWANIYIHEYSGIDTTNPLDAATSATGTAAAMNSGAITTTNANDLLFGAAASANTVTAAGATFSARSTASGNLTEDRNVTSAGSYTATATQNGNLWALQVAAFKVSSTPTDTTPPSVPTALTAAVVSTTQVNLAWTASTDKTAVTGYRVYRGAGVVATVTTNSFADLGLAPSTTYTYRVLAFDAAGNASAQSTPVTATTLSPPDTTAPSIPAGLTATASSPTQLNLSWTASTDDVAVTGYRVYRGAVLVATVATINYTDTGLTPATSYSYTVVALDRAGNASAPSTAATATTSLTTPTGLTAIAVSTTQITLSWAASPDPGLAGYNVYRGATLAATVATNSVTDLGLMPSTTYSYQVVAVDVAGDTSARSTAAAATTFTPPDTTAPSTPAVLTATAVSAGQINLTWAASSDDAAVTSYRVYRGITLAATVFSTSYADAGLSSTTTYSYTVTAVDGAGNESPASLPATATTLLSFPAGVSATAVSTTQINLVWTPSLDSGVAGYLVYRGSTVVATVPIASYADTSLTPATPYTYAVAAIDAAGSASAPSSAVTATTLTPPDTTAPSAPEAVTATAISPTQINLGWTVSSDDTAVTGYRVYRGTTIAATVTTTSYADVGLTPATTYSYTVTAIDAAGNESSAAAIVAAATPPDRPIPTSVSANQRYLLDQHGQPYLLHGDSSGQAVIGALTLDQADVYFADRASFGINAVWINLMCTGLANYAGCNNDASTVDGIAPFLTQKDFSTPNPVYFQRAAAIVELAQKYGITVFLDPAETTGWLSAVNSNGPVKDYAFGQFLGTYFRSYPNIVWYNGNDLQTWSNPTDDANVAAIARGIRSTDPAHLQTVELNYFASSSLDDAATWQSIINLNGVYSYYPTYAEVLHAYNQSPTMPAILIEANYEFDNLAIPPPTTPETLRRQEYWTMTSGSAGQLYGNHYEWAATTFADQQAHLDSDGVTQFQYMSQLFTGLPWYNLVPDQSHLFLAAGYGTFDSNPDDVLTSNYVTAASTPDGLVGTVYVPATSTITLNLNRLAGAVTARWFDPTINTYRGAGAGIYPAASGLQQFTSPGVHADGASDWLLVLTGDSTPDTTAPATPIGLSATATSASQINLTWTASTDNAGVAGYTVLRDGAPIATSATTTYSDSGLAANAAYTYSVVANDFAGNASGQSSVATATTKAVVIVTTPTFVQIASADPSTPQSTLSVGFSSAQTSGNTNIIAIGWNTASGTILGVTDTSGNTYQLAAPVFRNSSMSQAIYYASNIKMAARGNTITVQFSAALSYVDLRASEFSGLDPASPLDSTTSASGSATSASSGNVTTRFANELLFSAGMTTGTFKAAGSGFTLRIITSPDADMVETRTLTTAGSYAATATQSGSWIMQVVAFKAAGQ